MQIKETKLVGIDFEGREWELINRVQASEIYGCNPSRITALSKANKLQKIKLEPEARNSYYLRDEVESVSIQNRWIRGQVMSGMKKPKWRDEKMTPHQKRKLAEIGIEKENLTKGEASDLIMQGQRQPKKK
jgi:hypothetical protein